MSAEYLSQEELVEAFNRIMPKRPTYPPLVPDDDVLSNSATDSEGSDDEHEESKRQMIAVHFTAAMTPECRRAWDKSGFKHPDRYLDDNIQKDLEIALNKLINLRIKPHNPIEWLGYCLMNMNISDPRPPSKDHEIKPDGADLSCEVTVNFRELAYHERPFNTPGSTPYPDRNFGQGKRKMSDE